MANRLPTLSFIQPMIVLFMLATRLNFTNALDLLAKIHMVKKPDSLVVPIGDEVVFECETSHTTPDRFEWRQFRSMDNLNDLLEFNTHSAINMSDIHYVSTGKYSRLIVKVEGVLSIGDYQCLAYYGSAVFASVPGRLVLAEINPFPFHANSTFTVFEGNTITLQCPLPISQPTALIKYYRSGQLLDSNLVLATGSILLENISGQDSGNYSCLANNYISGETVFSSFHVELKVIRAPSNYVYMAPKFYHVPATNYSITAGKVLFMECAAHGWPVPKITWTKLNSELASDHRIEQLPGGLRITNVTETDQGIYICEARNGKNSAPLIHHVAVMFYEMPRVRIKGSGQQQQFAKQLKEGQQKEIECVVEKGTPEPQIKWLLNGRNVIFDRSIEATSNRIYFAPVEHRHSGILQCFATNQVGTAYDLVFLNVNSRQTVPITAAATNRTGSVANSVYGDEEDDEERTADGEFAGGRQTRNRQRPENGGRAKKRKHSKSRYTKIPPSKPLVTRLTDESVMVRWHVPENKGMKIQFFKIQYKNLGPLQNQAQAKQLVLNESSATTFTASDWKTITSEISAFVRSFEVDSLIPEHMYKFRVAAVYSNNDHSFGPNSDRFRLLKSDFFARNPLPIPKLAHTESLSVSSIKIYWEFEPEENRTVDGFYINYLAGSSAGDYTKATVEGEHNREFVIRHLDSDTYYDIKMQSFTQQLASEFSPILKQKTMKKIKENTSIKQEMATTKSMKETLEEFVFFYRYSLAIGSGLVLTLLLLGCVFIFRCLKRLKKPNAEMPNKMNGNIHDNNTKYHNRPNSIIITNNNNNIGNNKMKITTNPMAEQSDNNEIFSANGDGQSNRRLVTTVRDKLPPVRLTIRKNCDTIFDNNVNDNANVHDDDDVYL